jgi:hypothetical protein
MAAQFEIRFGGYTARELHRLLKTASAADRDSINAELARRKALYGVLRTSW